MLRKETPSHIRQRLQETEAGLEACVLNVLAQEQLVERLRAQGRDTRLAERLLVSFRDLLTLRMTARDRIKALLQMIDRLPRGKAREASDE